MYPEVRSQTLYKRKKDGKKLPYYYCRFIFNDDTIKSFSTKQTTQYAARLYAARWLHNYMEQTERLTIKQEKELLQKQREEIANEMERLQQLKTTVKKELQIPTLSDYHDFFEYGGRFYLSKVTRGVSISKRHCLGNSATFKNHVLPFFADYKVSQIDAALIAKFRTHLYQDKALSGRTINLSLTVLKEILTDAHLNNYISSIPLIQRFAVVKNEKDILTPEEQLKLFPDDYKKIWIRAVRETAKGINLTDLKLTANDKIVYAVNLFAYDTGCRLGECQAIRINRIDFNTNVVTIDAAYDNRCRETNEKTKTDRDRQVVITQKCADVILELITGRKDDAYVFSIDGITPLDAKVIQKGFGRALAKIGIAEDIRRQRNLTFHSYRYLLNTDMVQTVGGAIAQKITGHATDRMTQHYLKPDEVQEIKKVQDKRLKH